MTAAKVPFFGSLRFRIIALLSTAAAIAALSAGLLFYGLSSSQKLIDKSQSAQVRIESFIVLASQLSEYRTATEAMLNAGGLNNREKLQLRQQVEPVRQAFTRLLSLNVEEVDTASGDDLSKAIAKGVILSRMKAQFDTLHRSLSGLDESPQAQITGGGALNAFGVTVSPMLLQTIEDERHLTTLTHQQIAQLRKRLILIALAAAAIALLAFIAIFFAAGRPLLRRIDETIHGAEAIAAGELSSRLVPTGNDELTRLMQRFNTMSDNLASREAELRTAQASLQETVDRQTADLRQVNNRLETIDANRRKFFADVSHELRTPLTVVQGEAEFNLNEKVRLKPSQMRKSFQTILVRARELRRRVDDMIRVARSESGRLDLDHSLVDLAEIAANAVDGESHTTSRRHMKLRFVPSGEPLPVNGDQDWLRQVISGLIMNALKYAPDSKSIEVRARRDANQAIVEVADQGPGIGGDEIPRIFDRFVQASNTSGSDGFGIGLHLAKWVIEEHAGSISMRNNEPAPGLTVIIMLPLAPADT